MCTHTYIYIHTYICTYLYIFFFPNSLVRGSFGQVPWAMNGWGLLELLSKATGGLETFVGFLVWSMVKLVIRAYIGIIWDHYRRATRLQIRSCGHGSFGP